MYVYLPCSLQQSILHHAFKTAILSASTWTFLLKVEPFNALIILAYYKQKITAVGAFGLIICQINSKALCFNKKLRFNLDSATATCMLHTAHLNTDWYEKDNFSVNVKIIISFYCIPCQQISYWNNLNQTSMLSKCLPFGTLRRQCAWMNQKHTQTHTDKDSSYLRIIDRKIKAEYYPKVVEQTSL